MLVCVAGAQGNTKCGGWNSICGGLNFWVAHPFTVLVKGAGFSSMRNTSRAKKEPIGIGQGERENRGSENPHS